MAHQEAIFIGANRQPHIASLHPSRKIIAFGASRTIALWDPLSTSSQGVYSTLKAHQGEITCVRFIHEGQYLVSAGEDAKVCLWRFKGVDSNEMELVRVLEGDHLESVDCIGVFGSFFTTGDTAGDVILWKVDDGDGDVVKKIHSFKCNSGVLPLSLAIQEVEKDQYVLAMGGSKFQIFIYTFTYANQVVEGFTLSTQLEGHEDWVKALAFKPLGEGDYLLASGSQDRYIRLWRLRTNERIDRSDEDTTKLTLLSNKQYKFSIGTSTQVAINFEALIMGHDDWISSLTWHESKLQLLASSADTAMMIWEPDQSSGIWVCAARLGEISSKGASTATGSSGGFWAAIWFQDDLGVEHILTNGKTGAWRKWSCADGNSYDWNQDLAITGPTRQCTDVSWSINGEYLLATSLDQTTRLYSRWLKNADDTRRGKSEWREFARPQIHGYDMICLSSLSDTRFISSGDEKILRSFDEPRGVAQLLNKFCDITMDDDQMPESAALPALGLSNKATATAATDGTPIEADQDRRETDETNNISYEILKNLEQPPLEDHLQRHTLWPEIEKLYGHGYEMISVDTSPDKKLVASSCRSNTQQHAVVRLFDTTNWQELKPNLKLHELTVTRVKFSPRGDYLLTVSRDRQFGVWGRRRSGEGEEEEFTLVFSNEKAHTRIIWDCSWAPAEYGQYFFTASRDKSVKVWKMSTTDSGLDVALVTQTKFSGAVTAIDVYPRVINGKCVVAVGLESGKLAVLSFKDDSLSVVHGFSDEITPGDRIARVNWSFIDGEKLLLAVASHDNSTRIYSLEKCLL